jgi:hypothetical protein
VAKQDPIKDDVTTDGAPDGTSHDAPADEVDTTGKADTAKDATGTGSAGAGATAKNGTAKNGTAKNGTAKDASDDDADDDADDDEEDAAEEGADDALDDDDLDEDALDDDDDEDGDDEDADEEEQTPESALFWSDAEIDPVEIALPSGVGLTLRHYRAGEDDDGDEVEEAVFLAHRGKLHLFRSAEGLVEFINSDAPHDLTELDGWAEVAGRCEPSDIVASEEDRYELDLVVENLRGGHDVWEPDLIIGAGEIARDVAFACRLDDVLASLAPGSPLDELDEGLRNGGFMARRRLRKIGEEQAAIAWRSIIGKISAVITWHD